MEHLSNSLFFGRRVCVKYLKEKNNEYVAV
jgi:hypothetical protein